MQTKKYYNANNISYYDTKNNRWLHGHDAIKYMKCIRSGDSNWDLYLDEKNGWIYYVAVVPGCDSGFWGTLKYFKRRYGHNIPAEQ